MLRLFRIIANKDASLHVVQKAGPLVKRYEALNAVEISDDATVITREILDLAFVDACPGMDLTILERVKLKVIKDIFGEI